MSLELPLKPGTAARLLLAVSLLSLAACARSGFSGWAVTVPEIAQDLPANWVEGDREFDARVKAAFPREMPVADLIAELREQGFTINEGRRTASFEKNQLPCVTTWFVIWQQENDKIKDIRGQYGVGCL